MVAISVSSLTAPFFKRRWFYQEMLDGGQETEELHMFFITFTEKCSNF
jgi:hypothetical protein